MKYAQAVLLLIVLLIPPVCGQELNSRTPAGRTENIQDLIEEAMSRNPGIAVGLHAMEATKAHEPQAGALMDPELTFKLMEIPGTDLNRASYANVELMQVVPFPGKLSGQREIAELLTEHAHHDHMETMLSVVADLKRTVAMLWFARESRQINQSSKSILTRILRSVETAYAVGQSSQQEMLKTNVELAKLEVEEARIGGAIASSESSLRAILNRKSGDPIGVVELPAFPSVIPSYEQLLACARENRPMLIHDSLNVLEKQMNIGLMKKDYLPDFKFSLEYVRMPVLMENRWSFSAGLTLPIAPWTIARTSSKVQEAEAERSMLSAMFESSKNNIAAQIRTEYETLRALRAQLNAFEKTMLPQTQQSIDLLLTEYETGTSSYMMLLDGYRMSNNMNLEYAMTKMKYEETLADLEHAIGVTDIRMLATIGKDGSQ